jgi:hypothetical protein
MAITNLRITEVVPNQLEGAFTTDAVALLNGTGTIATPAAATASNLVTVASITPFTVGDVVKVDGIGPSGVPVIAGISAIPDANSIGLQGTRISTATVAQPITVLPVLYLKHNAKRLTLRNLTSGDSWEWDSTMPYGSAFKRVAAGAQSYTATDGFYVRGGAVYLHPALYAINSSYSFRADY